MARKKKLFSHIVRDFLRTDQSASLDVYDREILRVVSDYMDMSKGTCFKERDDLLFECGIKKTVFYNRVNNLIKNEYLFKKLDSRGKPHYSIGEKIFLK